MCKCFLNKKIPMGGAESVERVLNELNLDQEICNKIVDEQVMNATFRTVGSTDISNTINNMMKTVNNQTTNSNTSISTSIVVDIEMTNNMNNNDITIDGSTDVSFKQTNEQNTQIQNYNEFEHKVWSESDVLMNVDADIMQTIMNEMSVQNQATAQQTTDDQLDNMAKQMSDMVSSIDMNKENISEGEVNNLITTFGNTLSDISGDIFGRSSESTTENIQNIKSVIKNELERRNITNVDQIAESFVTSAFTFNNTNTVENYCMTISSYTEHLDFLASAKMTNNFNNNRITITDSTNVSFEQQNVARTALINTMLTKLSTGNNFSNTNSTEVKSQTAVQNYVENMNTTKTTQEATTAIKNTLDNVVSQTASLTKSETNKSTSIVSSIAMAVVGCIVAVVLVIAVIGKVLTSSNTGKNVESVGKSNVKNN